jgi:hypothetical protein
VTGLQVSIGNQVPINEDTNVNQDIGDLMPIEPIGEWSTLKLQTAGLERTWRKRINGGYRIYMVFDSGAIKTVIPANTVPGMQIKKTKNTGRMFRSASGNEIPNQGETTIQGGGENGGALKVVAQVADITKPLASANEIVDAGNLVVMVKDEGLIKSLSPEDAKRVMDLIKSVKGTEIPMKRDAGAFKIAIDVKDDSNPKDTTWQTPKKTVKATGQSSAMDVDCTERNQYEAIQCQDCEQTAGFHRLVGM